MFPDPSLSTEQNMGELGILNLTQQLTYTKGMFMHKVLLTITQLNYLAQLFIIHQARYSNSRNSLHVTRPKHILRWSVPLELPTSKI